VVQAMLRLSAASQASAEWVQRQADMLNKAMLKDKKKEGSDVRYGVSLRLTGLSFKEKLQEETDEWLDKVLD